MVTLSVITMSVVAPFLFQSNLIFILKRLRLAVHFFLSDHLVILNQSKIEQFKEFENIFGKRKKK